jgi:DNA invertase Pin-like site-specific DNA recombinase
MLSQYAKDKITCTNFDLKMEYLEEVFERLIDKIMENKKQSEQADKPLMTIEDIARKFQVTKATVHNWKKRGSIVGQKFGKNRYFTEDEVRKSMAKYGFTKQWDNRVEND